MLSSVFLSGRLGDKVDSYTRLVEVDEVIPGPTGLYRVHHIPVRTPKGSKYGFLSVRSGALVIIKGRLETDPELGLYVMLEMDETFPIASKEMKRKKGED